MNKSIYALAISVLVIFPISAFSQGISSAKLLASDSASRLFKSAAKFEPSAS